MKETNPVLGKKQRYWESQWRDKNFNPHWLGRGVPREVVEARGNGWLPAQGSVLDIGCGDGLLTAWFSEQGYRALGFDFSPAAVKIARRNCMDCPSSPKFIVLDICQQPIPGGPYNIVIDRGCLHQIPGPGIPSYKNNLVAAASADARFVLICAAYRDGVRYGDPAEKQKHTTWVKKVFSGLFELEKVQDTYLDKYHGEKPDEAKGGIIFWLIRSQT